MEIQFVNEKKFLDQSLVSVVRCHQIVPQPPSFPSSLRQVSCGSKASPRQSRASPCKSKVSTRCQVLGVGGWVLPTCLQLLTLALCLLIFDFFPFLLATDSWLLACYISSRVLPVVTDERFFR